MEQVLLIADFGCDTCLWAPGLVSTDEHDHLLSAGLIARIRDWYGVYERDCYLRRGRVDFGPGRGGWVSEGNALVELWVALRRAAKDIIGVGPPPAL